MKIKFLSISGKKEPDMPKVKKAPKVFVTLNGQKYFCLPNMTIPYKTDEVVTRLENQVEGPND